MQQVTLRQLRTVSAIARHGKIASAARHVGLTAPALTIQLGQLEANAGVSLFDRTREGMRLTVAGEAVLASAQAIEGQLRILSDELDAIKGLKTGRLRLGVVSTAKYFAPRIMAEFQRRFPGIAISLLTGNRSEIVEAVKSRTVDMALMGRPPRDVGVRAAVIGEHPLVIVAPPGHPLDGQRNISKDRIAEEHFLVREPGSGTRVSLEIFLSDIPGRLDDLGMEMDSNETIKQAVMAGLGIAFISGHTIAAELESGRLAVLDVEGLPVRRQWFAIARADRVMSPAMTALHGFLIENGASFLPTGPWSFRSRSDAVHG